MRTRTEHAGRDGKPRFRIQRLEERIAPKKTCVPIFSYCGYRFVCYNAQGKVVGPFPKFTDCDRF